MARIAFWQSMVHLPWIVLMDQSSGSSVRKANAGTGDSVMLTGCPSCTRTLPFIHGTSVRPVGSSRSNVTAILRACEWGRDVDSWRGESPNGDVDPP
jgi:hypothetical protein